MSLNELHKRLMDGEIDCESVLFRRLTERFRQFANHRIWGKNDAEDVVQEAIMVISKEYRDIEIRSSFAAWAYKILSNRILSYIEKKKRRQVQQTEYNSEFQKNIESSPDPDLRMRLLNCLKKIDAINKQHARIINLQSQGYQAEEISRQLSITKNALYIALHRARKALKLCLETGDIK